MIAITNSLFFSEDLLIKDQTIFIEDGKINRISNEVISEGYEIIDAKGSYICPAFIDLQIYGSGGNLFSAYPSIQTLKQMDEDLLFKGTTSFLACVATNSKEVIYQCLDAAKAYQKEAKGFLGLHLEGPYINPKRKGAHVEKYIYKATLEDVKHLLDYADGTVKMMTIAAELQDEEIIKYLVDQGIILSLGHSDADFTQATAAYNNGFKTTTHLFNAMPSIHHRAPNLPLAVMNHPTAMASIIADGCHVDLELVKMTYKVMKDRLFLITDAVTACAIGPYQHELKGDKFVTADGTLSGSNITLLQAVQNCVKHCDIPIYEAFKLASKNPALLMGILPTKGSINAGSDADLLFLSPELELKKVFVKGLHI